MRRKKTMRSLRRNWNTSEKNSSKTIGTSTRKRKKKRIKGSGYR